MAYKMEYGLGSPITRTTKHAKTKYKISPKRWIVLGLLVALVVICVFTDVLIPGDSEVTKAAINEFVNDIKGGEQVVDAFAAFCQTVLQGG